MTIEQQQKILHAACEKCGLDGHLVTADKMSELYTWAYAQDDRVLPPVEPLPTPASENTAEVEPISTPPAEIDFEPQKPRGTTEILTTKETPRDNPTPKPLSAPTPSRQQAVEPQMGDTRIVGGQQQVYLLGFGWIEDSDEPKSLKKITLKNTKQKRLILIYLLRHL